MSRTRFASLSDGLHPLSLFDNLFDDVAPRQHDFLTGWYWAFNPWVRSRSSNLFDNANNGLIYGQNYGVTAFLADGNTCGTSGHNSTNNSDATFARVELSSIADVVAARTGVVGRWTQIRAADTGYPPRLCNAIYDVTRLSGRTVSFGGRMKASTNLTLTVKLVSFYGLVQKRYTATAGQTVFTGLPHSVTSAADLRVFINGTETTAFTATGTTFTLNSGASNGASVVAFYEFGRASAGSPSLPVVTTLGTISVGTTYAWCSIEDVTVPDILTGKTLARHFTLEQGNAQYPQYSDYNLLVLEMPTGATFTLDIASGHLFNGSIAPEDYIPDPAAVRASCQLWDQSTYPEGSAPGTAMTTTNGMIQFTQGLGTAAGSVREKLWFPRMMLDPDVRIYSLGGTASHMTDLDDGSEIEVAATGGSETAATITNVDAVTQGHRYAFHIYLNCGLSS